MFPLLAISLILLVLITTKPKISENRYYYAVFDKLKLHSEPVNGSPATVVNNITMMPRFVSVAPATSSYLYVMLQQNVTGYVPQHAVKLVPVHMAILLWVLGKVSRIFKRIWHFSQEVAKIVW